MTESISIIAEYVQLLVEKKIREADISDGQKAKWGSRKHISDLKRRLKEAEYWRDKQKKGSEKIAHYRNVVNDIRQQLKKAIKSAESKKKED
jgi:isocitrate dehydrogenase kinase/phosphatase